MVGIDIVDMRRIELSSSFIHHLLTAEEMDEYTLLHTDKRRKEYIAAHFASKEAIFKCTQDKNYLKYTILHKENGQPYIKDHSSLSISIAHDGDYCIAIVQA